MEILGQESIDIRDWYHFIGTCSSATVSHLPEWSRILKNSFGYKPLTLFAKNSDGLVCGILPLFLVKSPLIGSRLVSSPFFPVSGPLVTSDKAIAPIIEEAKKLSTRFKCSYLEIRLLNNLAQDKILPYCKNNGFEVNNNFFGYSIPLTKSEIIWNELSSTRRWAIRKARKEGVSIRKSDSLNDIGLFFELNLKAKQRLGVPGQPLIFFINIFAELGKNCQLYIAELKGKVIAGIITIKFNNTVLYGYGATLEKYKSYQPSSLLLWTAIEQYCQEGCTSFDLGRISVAEEGLARYKKNWGAKAQILDYCFFPHVPRSINLDPQGTKYKLITGVWKKMPLPLARIGSNIGFKHIG